jgi:hypothetical protein
MLSTPCTQYLYGNREGGREPADVTHIITSLQYAHLLGRVLIMVVVNVDFVQLIVVS